MSSTDTRTTTTTTTKQTKRVSFSDLTVTEYPIILGENPACTGCPITIDWEPMGSYTCDLELYEQFRQLGRSRMHSDNSLLSNTTKSRRSSSSNIGNMSGGKASRRKMVLSVRTRTQMLLDAGYTPDQIIRRTLEVAEIRDQRAESIKRSSSSSSFFSKSSRSSNSFGSGSSSRNTLFQKQLHNNSGVKKHLSDKFRKSFVKLGGLGSGSSSPRPSRKPLTAPSA